MLTFRAGEGLKKEMLSGGLRSAEGGRYRSNTGIKDEHEGFLMDREKEKNLLRTTNAVGGSM